MDFLAAELGSESAVYAAFGGMGTFIAWLAWLSKQIVAMRTDLSANAVRLTQLESDVHELQQVLPRTIPRPNLNYQG